MLGAEIGWVRELLRYCTGRATLRAYGTPTNLFEDDKDGVKVAMHTRARRTGTRPRSHMSCTLTARMHANTYRCACDVRAHAHAHVDMHMHMCIVHVHAQVEIYKDLKTEVDRNTDFPTASTCARTIYLPVFAEEQHFVEKLQKALDEFKLKAEFEYQ